MFLANDLEATVPREASHSARDLGPSARWDVRPMETDGGRPAGLSQDVVMSGAGAMAMPLGMAQSQQPGPGEGLGQGAPSGAGQPAGGRAGPPGGLRPLLRYSLISCSLPPRSPLYQDPQNSLPPFHSSVPPTESTASGASRGPFPSGLRHCFSASPATGPASSLSVHPSSSGPGSGPGSCGFRLRPVGSGLKGSPSCWPCARLLRVFPLVVSAHHSHRPVEHLDGCLVFLYI